RGRHTRFKCDWSSDVCSSDLITAGIESIQNIFWPLTEKPGKVFTGYLDSALMVIFIAGVVLVMIDALRRWYLVLHGAPVPREARSEERRVGKGWRWRWARGEC